MLDRITPVILTCNEAPNIGRTLARLGWAADIVVVDSFSQDETAAIVAGFPRARLFRRVFDGHAAQWNYALTETGIATPWVLALDADYQLPDRLIEEISRLEPAAETSGYRARFRYCVNGRVLRGAAYPSVTVLYRIRGARYRQDGHTQRIELFGRVETLRFPVDHDDRKPLAQWVQSQIRYLRLEADKLSSGGGRQSLSDRLRLMRVVAPFVMLLYCLFYKRGILDGRAGIFYAFQRAFAELLLSLYLLERAVVRETPDLSK